MKPTKFQKIRALASGMIANLIIGSYYNLGNINGPISTYFHLDVNTTSLVFTIWLITQSITSTFSLVIAEKIGYRLTQTIAFTVFSLINIGVSFLPGEQIYGYLFIA